MTMLRNIHPELRSFASRAGCLVAAGDALQLMFVLAK